MSFIDAFLNVLAIIGIIVAGGFLVFFLGDVLLSILEPRRKQKQQEEEISQSNEFSLEEAKTQEQEQVFSMEDTVTEQKFTMDEEVQPVDYDAAEAEKRSLGIVEEQPVQKEEETDINALFNDDEDFDFSDNFDFDKLFEEDQKVIEEKSSEEIAESDILPILPATVAQEVAGNDPEFEAKLQKEIESLKAELEEQKALYADLKQQAKNNEEKWEIEKADLEKLYKDAEEIMEEKPVANLSLEEYEERLEVLRARLKVNEKELKANKKEFLPLKRVRKNLDKDKEKLRRREALVAKQKVMLYGVNNISDIDQEKAQKLAEDLDLLDGLKVSVRHCEEVMEANKDRYPVLETANRILLTQNQEIKDDIAQCEEAIKNLKGNVNDDGAELKMVAEQPAKEVVETPAVEEVAEVQQETIEEVKQEEVSVEELIQTANETINSSETEKVLVIAGGEDIAEDDKPKRKRGRPKKESSADIEQQSFDNFSLDEEPKFDFEAEPYKFDFDADEPSLEDLMAIEEEERRNSEDKF